MLLIIFIRDSAFNHPRCIIHHSSLTRDNGEYRLRDNAVKESTLEIRLKRNNQPRHTYIHTFRVIKEPVGIFPKKIYPLMCM